MDQYKVLLVDDEEEVIQIIMKKIDWEGLGFSVVGHACNGIKALELVEELQPDVVMTDIKMPFMDGMELSRRIREGFPAIKILFFTGFDEFEYAKGAIQLEAEQYILKPVNAVELSDVYTRLKIKLDREISEKRNVETLQKYYMDSLPVLQANFYTSLLEGRLGKEEISQYLSDYQISFSGPFFSCLVIHTSSSHIPDNMNVLLLSTSVQKQAEERLAQKWQAKCFSYLGNAVLIGQLKNMSDITELTDDCDRFCKYAKAIIGAVVTVGIGRVCGDILELPQSYLGAREAVSYRAIYGSSKAINMKEIIPRETNKFASDKDVMLSELFKVIRFGSEEDVARAAEHYLTNSALAEESLQQHQVRMMELVSSLYKFLVTHGVDVPGFSGNIQELYDGLVGLEPDALGTWLAGICLSIREKLIHARNKSTKSFVARAEEYVQKHYGEEELSLDSICGILGVSNAYFSTIFKKETGSSFISYLTDFRLELAREMLVDTDEKSYMIAKSVGYADPNYFSYVFKRKFGVSPSIYRREHGGSEG